jgi:hypothetical protein
MHCLLAISKRLTAFESASRMWLLLRLLLRAFMYHGHLDAFQIIGTQSASANISVCEEHTSTCMKGCLCSLCRCGSCCTVRYMRGLCLEFRVTDGYCHGICLEYFLLAIVTTSFY